MSKSTKAAFAIIDVETTGLSAKNEKITEIAILIHDGQKEVERFHTLLDPERNIPYRITRLTGINNQMVAGAPKFYEIAKKILQLTQGRTIVGHNVAFDYNFIKAEFKEFNYDFQSKTLCTVRLARKAFPGLPSYSLSKITRQLNIPHSDQHRATGDAEATKLLFERIQQEAEHLIEQPTRKLPKALSEEKIAQLPNTAGVYYFLDAMDQIIYVGKSKHIRQRVQSHLNNNSTKKAIEMQDNITNIRITETGSELIALLLESEEIKRLKPLYNRAQIRSVFRYSLYLNMDKDGYFNLEVDKTDTLRKPLTSFSSKREATDFLHLLVEEYQLCQAHCGLHQGDGPCFNYQVHQCAGACCGEESPENYNEKVSQATDRLRYKHEDFTLLEPGRHAKEYGIVGVKAGSFYGFGYLDKKDVQDAKKRQEAIQPHPSNRDSNSIIQSWIRHKSYEMIIE
jgi:DNA polymerase-3 subunit epsilon